MTILQTLAAFAVGVSIIGLILYCAGLLARIERLERNVRRLTVLTYKHTIRTHPASGDVREVERDGDELHGLANSRSGYWHR